MYELGKESLDEFDGIIEVGVGLDLETASVEFAHVTHLPKLHEVGLQVQQLLVLFVLVVGQDGYAVAQLQPE